MRRIGDELREKRNDNIADYYKKLGLLKSEDLSDMLKEYVIGQDEFIGRFVPQFMAMRSRMMLAIEGRDESELPRLSSACIIGPTASGKTYFFKILSKVSEVPIHTVDCTSLTGAGWKGGDIESELAKVAALQESYPCMPIMVVWDEADKMRHEDKVAEKSSSAQQTFLKYLDGGTYRFTCGDKSYSVDTRFVINIFLGAFTGIEDIVKKRLNTAPSIGFAAPKEAGSEVQDGDWRKHVNADDLQEWGMFKEFCGRVGPIESIPALSEKDLAYIVNGCEHSLEKKYELMLLDGCSLKITDAAARALAQKALDSALGARALEGFLQPVATQAIDKANGTGAAKVVIGANNGELFFRTLPSLHEASHSTNATDLKLHFYAALESEIERKTSQQEEKESNDGDQEVEEINKCFQHIYFDLAYFLGAERGPERIAKCLAAECIADDQGIPRAFSGSYKETCFALLLHFLCKYERRFWTFGELYGLARLANNRDAFKSLFEGAVGIIHPSTDSESAKHLSSAKNLMSELDSVSPEAFWKEAESLAAMLSACQYKHGYPERIAERIHREFPPGRNEGIPDFALPKYQQRRYGERGRGL